MMCPSKTDNRKVNMNYQDLVSYAIQYQDMAFYALRAVGLFVVWKAILKFDANRAARKAQNA